MFLFYILILFLLFYIIVTTSYFFFFFFNDTATTEIYTLSLHDALPIWPVARSRYRDAEAKGAWVWWYQSCIDRKSTRLNSSHRCISYAVFCLKKKKQNNKK